jgi:hypothetical protein
MNTLQANMQDSAKMYPAGAIAWIIGKSPPPNRARRGSEGNNRRQGSGGPAAEESSSARVQGREQGQGHAGGSDGQGEGDANGGVEGHSAAEEHPLRMVMVDNELFGHFRLSSSMVSAHLPRTYEKELEYLLASQNNE